MVKHSGRRWPSSAGTDLYPGAPELSGEGACVDLELGRNDLEGLTLAVVGRSALDDAVGHLADDFPTLDAAAVEVADDRRAVKTELPGERIDRRPRDVLLNELVDGRFRQASLHRV